MNVVVVGSGYVGLVTGACLANMGIKVTCVDNDANKVAKLQQGIIPIYEPGLEEIVRSSVAEGLLEFSTSLGGAVRNCDVVFITVGTPIDSNGAGADLSFVIQAAEEIAHNLDGYTVVVAKSTVPVGTAKKLAETIRAVNPTASFEIVSNPEFLREGSAVEDFFHPDRIVVGARRGRAEQIMRQLYEPLTSRGVPLVLTSNEAAEVIKYSSNTYLAMRIALVNQLADICESVGADINEVTYGMGLDHRIGPHYLKPGPGFGGSCFPKDARALASTARAAGTPTSLIEATIEANERRRLSMTDRIKRAVGGSVKNKRIGILGIAFKANTDDIRDSTAIMMIPALQDAGAIVQVFDPAAMEQGGKVFSNVKWCEDGYETALGADVLVILTEWPQFKLLDLKRIRQSMKKPVLVDLRNLFDFDEIVQSGLDYHSVGRMTIFGSGFARECPSPTEPGTKVIKSAKAAQRVA